MIESVALTIVVASGIFFVALGGSALFASQMASRFLLAFATTPAKHYMELAIRFIIGGAFVSAAPLLSYSQAFNIFGWLLVGTTVILVFVPWRWHHQFAQRAVPDALRFLPLIGVSSTVLGALVLWAVRRGAAI